jgi:hypothetical protein
MVDCEPRLQLFKGHRMHTSQLRYLESDLFSSVVSIWSNLILYARILRGFPASIHTFKILRQQTIESFKGVAPDGCFFFKFV